MIQIDANIAAIFFVWTIISVVYLIYNVVKRKIIKEHTDKSDLSHLVDLCTSIGSVLKKVFDDIQEQSERNKNRYLSHKADSINIIKTVQNLVESNKDLTSEIAAMHDKLNEHMDTIHKEHMEFQTHILNGNTTLSEISRSTNNTHHKVGIIGTTMDRHDKKFDEMSLNSGLLF